MAVQSKISDALESIDRTNSMPSLHSETLFSGSDNEATSESIGDDASSIGDDADLITSPSDDSEVCSDEANSKASVSAPLLGTTVSEACNHCCTRKVLRPSVSQCDHVPAYMLVPHIKKGYRVHHSSYDAFLSLFRLHNESLNVWSHLLMLLFFMWRTAVFILEYQHTPQWIDFVPYLVYLVTAQVCFGASVIYHLFGCISEKASIHLCACDFVGILVLIGGSYFPGLYYGFYCMQTTRRIYIAILAVLSTLATCASSCEWFHRNEWRVLRIAVFGGLAGSGVIPSVHWVLKNGISGHEADVFFGGVAAMYASYASGLAVYILRVPERYFPGKFDFCLWSHQIWHIFVVCGAYFYYRCVADYCAFRITHGCPAQVLVNF
mmetsp:Transcript_148/g.275  ORF Transcript_148/g.275 Transcript_148/m.275 type:complete len:379 (-) Transcript_148:314-1450(-)